MTEAAEQPVARTSLVEAILEYAVVAEATGTSEDEFNEWVINNENLLRIRAKEIEGHNGH